MMANLLQHKVELSIIIPHYNSPKELKRLLTTIPKEEAIQTIVIDDLSNKDIDIYEQVKVEFGNYVEFYDNRINNKTAGGARNIGLEMAKGTWLIFADADDYFCEDWWNSVKKYLTNEADIIFFPPYSVVEGTKTPSDRHIPYACMAYSAYDEIRKGKLSRRKEIEIRYGWWGPWSKLVKRSLIEKYNIKFDVVKYSNDVKFSSLAGYYAEKIDVAWEYIYCITKGSGTLTTSIDDEKEKEFENNLRAKIYKEIFDFWFYSLSFKDGCLLCDIRGLLRKINYMRKRIQHKLKNITKRFR